MLGILPKKMGWRISGNSREGGVLVTFGRETKQFPFMGCLRTGGIEEWWWCKTLQGQGGLLIRVQGFLGHVV